jgi:hypothetical protein
VLKLESEDVLLIKVVKAKFYEKQDVFSDGDPYVVVTFDQQKFKTKVVNNTKTPVYNEGWLNEKKKERRRERRWKRKKGEEREKKVEEGNKKDYLLMYYLTSCILSLYYIIF